MTKFLMRETQTLRDGTESFNVSIHEATKTSPVALFAAGPGGQPEPYSSLLSTLVESGFTIIAPHFERLTSPMPAESDLMLRARRLSLALDAFAQPCTTVTGVGHSIGASTLLALAGAQMWQGPGQRLNIAPDSRLTRLALLAPPTGFFRAPGALDAVKAPLLIWVGSEDSITPPAQIEWLAHAMNGRQTVDIRVTEGAGHFSFMDLQPPQTTDPLPDKQGFLRAYSAEVCKFLMRQPWSSL